MSRARLALTVTVLLALVACENKPAKDGPESAPIPRLTTQDNVSEDVRRTFEQAAARVEAEPGVAETWMVLGSYYEANGFREYARDCYVQATRLNPQSAHHAYRLALVQRKLSEDEAARATLVQSLALDDGRAPSWRRLGDWALADGSLAEAAEAYRRATEIDALDGGAAAGTARVLLQSGRPQDAARYLQALPAPLSAEPYIQFLLGTAKRRLGQFEEALAALSRAGATPSRVWPDAWADELGTYLLGLPTRRARIDALIEQERWSDARVELERLVSERPALLALRLQLADVHRELGNVEGALEQLDLAIDVQPGHPELRLERALLRATAGSVEDALADLVIPLAGQRTAPRAGLVKLALESHVSGQVPTPTSSLEELFPSRRVLYEELAKIQSRLGWSEAAEASRQSASRERR